MFPPGPEREPEADVIGTPRADRPRRRFAPGRRWGPAGAVLTLAAAIAAVAAAIAAVAIPPLTHHAALTVPPLTHQKEPAPSGAGSLSPTPGPSAPGPPAPGPPAALVPPREWAASLNVATWPVEQNPSPGGVFALGVAGQRGWTLAVRAISRPGQGCAAEVTLLGGPPSSPPLRGVPAFRLPARPAHATPVGDLAFIALGSGARGVGLAFLRTAGPGGLVWADPHLVGELIISVPVVTVSACGRQYYLAGFAYPLQGTLDLSAMRGEGQPAEYVVPERLTRPGQQDVWQADG